MIDPFAKRVLEQSRELSEKLLSIDADSRADVFFEGIRESDILKIPCQFRDDPEALLSAAAPVLYHLAYADLPLTVGLTMHMFQLAALATQPMDSHPKLRRRLKLLVDTVENYNLILGVTSFGDQIRASGQKPIDVAIEENDDGSFTAQGKKGFLSMASQADLVVFGGDFEDGTMGLWYANIKDDKGVTPGPSRFGGPMAGTDTRNVNFDGVALKERNLLSRDNELTLSMCYYSTGWFEALISASYLGAAGRALEETRVFARSVHTNEDEMLAELDGFVVQTGPMLLKLRSGLAQIRAFGTAIGNYYRLSQSEADEQIVDRALGQALDTATATKFYCTEAAEEIVTRARRSIGTRCMRPGHIMHDLSTQVCFGALHPILESTAIRQAGSELLWDTEKSDCFPDLAFANFSNLSD